MISSCMLIHGTTFFYGRFSSSIVCRSDSIPPPPLGGTCRMRRVSVAPRSLCNFPKTPPSDAAGSRMPASTRATRRRHGRHVHAALRPAAGLAQAVEDQRHFACRSRTSTPTIDAAAFLLLDPAGHQVHESRRPNGGDRSCSASGVHSRCRNSSCAWPWRPARGRCR